MVNSSLATILEVGGLTAGEITYSVIKKSSIFFQFLRQGKKKQQLKQKRRDKNVER
jgi:hypothetical protein